MEYISIRTELSSSHVERADSFQHTCEPGNYIARRTELSSLHVAKNTIISVHSMPKPRERINNSEKN